MQVLYSGMVIIFLANMMLPAPNDGLSLGSPTSSFGLETKAKHQTDNSYSHKTETYHLSSNSVINYSLSACDYNSSAILLLDLKDYIKNSPAVELSFDSPLPKSWIKAIQAPDFFLLKVPLGKHKLLIKASQAQGGGLLHEIEINVSQNQIGEQLICQDTVFITLDANCQKLMTPDELLEGDLRCLENSDFLIHILDEEVSNQNVADGIGAYIYKVALKDKTTIRGPKRWLSVDRWSTKGNVTEKAEQLEITGKTVLQFPLAGTVNFKASSSDNYSLQWLDASGQQISQTVIDAGIDKQISQKVNPGEVLLVSSIASNASSLKLSNLSFEAILDPQLIGFEACVGYIKAEDRTAPKIQCKEEIRSGTFSKKVQLWNGTLDKDGDPLEVKAEFCDKWPSDLELGNHAFDTTHFQVSQTGWYAFELLGSWGASWGAIYQKSFDVNSPCDYLIANSKYSSDELGYFKNPQSARMYAYLKPQKNYILLSSSTKAEQTGGYQWAVFSEGEAYILGIDRQELDVCFPLLCGDVDKIFDEKESLEWLGGIQNLEDCSDTRISILDEEVDNDRCSGLKLRRRIEAKDALGNTSYCEQKIIFSKPDKHHLIPPLHKVYLSCDEFYVKDDKQNPHPSMTGYPGILSPFGIRSLRLQECNWIVSYIDEKLKGHCENETRIIRLWQLVDWCDRNNIITFKQEIIIGDFEGPTFDLVLPHSKFTAEGKDTFVVSTGAFDCTTTLAIPAPTNIKDNCSNKISIKAILKSPDGDTLAFKGIQGPEVYFEDIILGEYKLLYVLEDACNNKSYKELTLIIRDLIPPVAICDEEFNVSIGGDGIGRLAAVDVSEGSWDACSEIVDMKVRRLVSEDCLEEFKTLTGLSLSLDSISGAYYTPWDDEVYFICCDILEKVRIELQVTDKGGNIGYCWQDALIEDKILPKCLPPPSDTLDCTEYFVEDLSDSLLLQSLFGVPKVLDEHCPSTWIEFPAVWDNRDCSEGTLTRKFMAIDASGNRSDTCYQYIEVRKIHNYEIKFPKDVHNYKCTEQLADTMELNIIGCDVLAVNKDTLIFVPEGENCGEWHIVHRVINWCEIDNSNPIPLEISRNEDGDDLIGEDDVYVLVRPNDTAYIDNNNDETDGFFRDLLSTGYWQYTQIIEIEDTLVPLIIPDQHEPFCTYSSDCMGRVNFFFTTFDLCSRNNITITAYYDENNDGTDDDQLDDDQILGRVPKFRLSGDYPVGDHSFRIEITDGCGNTLRRRFPFSVIDCKAPAPVCIEQLAVELMPVYPAADVDGDGVVEAGMNVVWVSDFRPFSAFEDCFPEIRYSIHRADEIAHPDSSNIIVTCNDPDVLEVRIYAWDNAFNPLRIQPDSTVGGPNYDYCTAFIDIQDNQFNLCDGGINVNVIAGKIYTDRGVPIDGTTMNLSGRTDRTTITEAEGNYQFSNVETGYDYTISPQNTSNPMDGVTTFDLVLISKYILGIQELDNPYQYIAADINKSGTISSLDLIQLRKMILNISDQFPNNESWRFVDAAYDFGEDKEQWLSGIPEWININNLDPFSEESYDFKAIKVGDLNYSNSRIKEWLDIQERTSKDPVELSQNLYIQADGSAKVDLWMEETSQLDGFQFTISFDPDKFELFSVDLESSILSNYNLGYEYIEEGLITVSWNANSRQELKEGKKLLSFNFGTLSNTIIPLDVIQVNSRLLKAEAYDLSELIHPIILKKQDQLGGGLKLLGATPNPFRSRTDISFFTPQDEQITMELMDYNGRVVLRKTANFKAGWRQFEIQKHELPGSGLYLYTINDQQNLRSGKLILID